MHDMKFAQHVEEWIGIIDMEEELESHNQDVDLILRTQQVIVESSPPPTIESTPSEKGEVIPLDDDPIIAMYNSSYYGLQKNIVQSCKKHFLDDLTSPGFIRERVIVAYTRKNPNAIFRTNLAFTSAEKWNTKYLMYKNKKLENKLQGAMQEVEQLRTTTQTKTSVEVHLEEMRESILGELSTHVETMLNIYEEIVTMHKEIVHLHGLQQHCKYTVKTLRNVQATIAIMHEFLM